jgi:hypothetical protein
MQVIIMPNVLESFSELVTILYEKKYFGFEATALKYVTELYDDIIATLPIRPRKSAPSYFSKYGKGLYYAVFPKNKQTQWYAFFKIYRENGELYYQVRFIANNHTVAQYLH